MDGQAEHRYQHALHRLRQVEEALDIQQSFSDQLLATLQVAVVVLDEGGRVVYINPFMERLSGYRLIEVMDRDWFTTFLPARDHQHIRALFSQAIGGVQTRANINPIVTKDGEERLIQWSDHLLPAWAGNAQWLVASGIDVTDQVRERR